MSTSPAPAAAARRTRSTPYSRRLARERGLSLDALSGSGPDGRITGADVQRFRAPMEQGLDPAAASTQTGVAPISVPVPAAVPSALSVDIDFRAVQTLLGQLARAAITHEAVTLKAVAVSLDMLLPENEGAVLLMRGKELRRVSDIRHASLGGIAAKVEAAGVGEARIVVSFLARPGIRPVAARLEGKCEARLVVGFPDANGAAGCLLSYDPDRIEEGAAAEFLLLVKEWIETPLRLLV